MPRNGLRDGPHRRRPNRERGASNRGSSGTLSDVKLWYHVIAAIVGFAVAALIVYWVFGHASEEGATQEGSAGALGAAETLCGTISPSEATSGSARTAAAKNLPVVSNARGPIAGIRKDKPEQSEWIVRVHAASGLCIDEIRILDDEITVDMSTVAAISEADASFFTAAALAQTFTPPLHRDKVTIGTVVGNKERSVAISRRAWKAFEIFRESGNRPLDMQSLVRFRKETSFGAQDLRVTGWG